MHKTIYKAIVNNDFQFDEEHLTSDIVFVEPGIYQAISQNKTYRLHIEQIDYQRKLFTIVVNGTTYKVNLEDEVDRLVNELGLTKAVIQKLSNIIAPMPGLVLEVLAQKGQAVKPGDNLLILEAMKMENIIKSNGEGIVKEILIHKGDKVEKGDIMLEFE